MISRSGRENRPCEAGGDLATLRKLGVEGLVVRIKEWNIQSRTTDNSSGILVFLALRKTLELRF